MVGLAMSPWLIQGTMFQLQRQLLWIPTGNWLFGEAQLPIRAQNLDMFPTRMVNTNQLTTSSIGRLFFISAIYLSFSSISFYLEPQAITIYAFHFYAFHHVYVLSPIFLFGH